MYTQGPNRRPAAWFLEERLRNIKKRLRSVRTEKYFGKAKVPIVIDYIPMCVFIESTISEERAEQLK